MLYITRNIVNMKFHGLTYYKVININKNKNLNLQHFPYISRLSWQTISKQPNAKQLLKVLSAFNFRSNLTARKQC